MDANKWHGAWSEFAGDQIDTVCVAARSIKFDGAILQQFFGQAKSITFKWLDGELTGNVLLCN